MTAPTDRPAAALRQGEVSSVAARGEAEGELLAQLLAGQGGRDVRVDGVATDQRGAAR